MRDTKHFQQRMSQRGMNRSMVDLTLQFGEVEQDRHVLGRKAALALLDRLQQEARALKKIVDKGGIAVVTEGESLVTTYNLVEGGR